MESAAPLALQENYDNAGLLTGAYQQEISQAILCLDVTEEVLDEAIAGGCNLVIAHHPIIFSGIKKITGTNYVERILIKAISHHIAIYAMHTNLDNLKSGVNKIIADRLGLVDPKVLLPMQNKLMKLYTFAPVEHADKVREALFKAGAGNIGNYDECSFNTEGMGTFRGNAESNAFVGEKGKRHHEKEIRIEVIFPGWLLNSMVAALKASHPYEEVAYDTVELANSFDQTGAGMIGSLQQSMEPLAFFDYLKQKMKVKVIRHTALCRNAVKTVALCGGAGSFLLHHAIKAGADIFISADFKYHQFFDADKAIIIADIGHYESEQFTPEIFAAILKEKFPTFAVRFTAINTNPINYY